MKKVINLLFWKGNCIDTPIKNASKRFQQNQVIGVFDNTLVYCMSFQYYYTIEYCCGINIGSNQL